MKQTKKKLNKKQKAMLIGVAIVIMIICIIIIRGIVAKNTDTNNNTENISENNNYEYEEKYAEVVDDGTKVNKSEKIKEENKNVGSYEFSGISITSKDNQTLITAKVKNIGSSKTQLTAVDIKLLDENNQEMITLKKSALVDELEPNASTTVTVYCSSDFANAYDAELSISE